jgi:hypothetical protein
MPTSFSIVDLIIGGVLGFAATGLAAAAVGISRCMQPAAAVKRRDDVHVTVSGTDGPPVRSVAVTFFPIEE